MINDYALQRVSEFVLPYNLAMSYSLQSSFVSLSLLALPCFGWWLLRRRYFPTMSYSFQFWVSISWCFTQPARQCLPLHVSVGDASWEGVCASACVIVCLCLCFIEPACPSMFRLVTPAAEGEEVAPRLWAKCGSSRLLFNPVPATTIYTFTQTPLPRQLLHCRIYNIHFYTAATSKALHFSATMMGRTLACNS